MKSQTITIEWHPMSERPPKGNRYLVAEAVAYLDHGKPAVSLEVNERTFGRRGWSYGWSKTPGYAWAIRPTIEPPEIPKEDKQ